MIFSLIGRFFKSAWINDHLIGLQNGDEEMLEAWTIMTSIAAKTKKLKVGHTVLCNNFRNPALIKYFKPA